jgi:thioesterase domain-containing protein
MAAAIRARDGAGDDVVDPDARSSSSEPVTNLFYISPHESALTVRSHMATSLGEAFVINGLVAWRLGERVDRSKTIDSLAEEMLAEIRALQPQGPYSIAGYSLGGLVAYEVAGRLRAAGEAIDWLALLDSGEPSEVMRQRGRARAKGAQPRGHLPRRLAVTLRVRLGERLHWIRPHQFDLAGATAITLRHAVLAHDAPLDVFISDRTASIYGSSGGWDRLHKGDLRAHSVPGDHISIIEAPQLTKVVEIMRERMREISRNKLETTR